jgi:hypothetical protein
MKKKMTLISLLFMMGIISLAACSPFTDQLIANKYAEAVLTRNNELQFRIKINDSLLASEDPYKVKVTIHNQELAEALGTKEIIYGQEIVHKGEYLETNEKGQQYIYMTPVELIKDLHPFEIQKMIVNDQAITVEVFNDQEVLGRALLTNFSTQL